MFTRITEDDYPKLTAERIAEIKAKNLPHMKAADVLEKVAGETDVAVQDEMMAKADEYFKAFYWEPDAKKRGRCINCDRALAGQLFGGTFTWGLAHGEGYCGLCGYPCRAIHIIDGVGKLANFILQYHPSGLSIEKKEDTDGKPEGQDHPA